MIKLWQGSANTWDCDEMGHMNVRPYVEKAMEGMGRFAFEVDMPGAFEENSASTLLPLRQHIRYMREAMPGQPLTMLGGVLDWGDDWVDLYQEMRHGDGTPAAAMRTRLAHAEARSGRPFQWNARSRARLEALKVQPPNKTAPRSLDPDGEVLQRNDANSAAADAVGAPVIGAGMVAPSQVDAHGRMWAPWFIGRVSDSVPNLLFDWRQRVAASAGGERTGGAVLEYRLVYRRWPRTGDLFEVRTGLNKVEEKFHSLVHWMLDPETGEAWMTSEAVAVTFDLDTRKIIPTSGDQMAELEQIAPRGLKI